MVPNTILIQYPFIITHTAYFDNALSSAEAPRGWGRWIGEKKVRLGRREDRALSFTLSPASKLPTRPSAKEASAEERVDNASRNSLAFCQMLAVIVVVEEVCYEKQAVTAEYRSRY